ncbi:hypothetical protein K438DRAFT_1774939 [Mycena galopus ATCC 62051]|nr:hypothetical protein K438DRAFT_1774939 [Mycena galopus ATCC 62051]
MLCRGGWQIHSEGKDDVGEDALADGGSVPEGGLDGGIDEGRAGGVDPEAEDAKVPLGEVGDFASFGVALEAGNGWTTEKHGGMKDQEIIEDNTRQDLFNPSMIVALSNIQPAGPQPLSSSALSLTRAAFKLERPGGAELCNYGRDARSTQAWGIIGDLKRVFFLRQHVAQFWHVHRVESDSIFQRPRGRDARSSRAWAMDVKIICVSHQHRLDPYLIFGSTIHSSSI